MNWYFNYPESGNFTGFICAGAAAPAATGAELSTAGTEPVNGAVVCGNPIVVLEIGIVDETVEGKVEGTVDGMLPEIVEPAGAVGGKLPGIVEPVGGSNPGGACRPS